MKRTLIQVEHNIVSFYELVNLQDNLWIAMPSEFQYTIKTYTQMLCINCVELHVISETYQTIHRSRIIKRQK